MPIAFSFRRYTCYKSNTATTEADYQQVNFEPNGGVKVQMIYKICSREEWEAAVVKGRFDGAAVDIADGFIHFSTGAQLRETASKHFRGQSHLVLLRFDERALGDDLKWEVSRGGDLFPHLYSSLKTDLALDVLDLSPDADGVPCVPAEIS